MASGNFINLTFIILKYGVGLNDVTYLFCSNLKLCLPAQNVEVTKGKFQKNTECLHGAIIISKWSNLRQICEIQNCFFEIFVYTGLLLEEDLSNQSTFELKLLSAVGVQCSTDLTEIVLARRGVNRTWKMKQNKAV